MPKTRHNTLRSGSTLQAGRYIVDAVLGAGGFGVTYHATDTLLGRTVAVKELCPADSEREGSSIVLPEEIGAAEWQHEINSFLNEARAIARLDHPGIVKVYDYFKENNTAYNVMQFVDGMSLADLLKQRGGRLPEAETLGYIAAVGEALAVLHAAGMLHRDIKPHNIMFSNQGNIVLIDFGAARQFAPDRTMSHTVIATYGFAPPEQFHPKARRSPASDIYALAVTCYFLLTGDLPNPDDDKRVNPRILAAIEHATAYDPAARPQTVAAFLAELAGKFGATTIKEVDDVLSNVPRIADEDDTQRIAPDYTYELDSDELPEPVSEWVRVGVPAPNIMSALAFPSATEGWAVGASGMMLHYHEGEWTAHESEASDLLAIHMLDEQHGWAVGWYGMTMRYESGAWRRLDVNTSEHLRGVWMTSPDEGWAVGSHSIICRCYRGEWTVVRSPLRPFAERSDMGFAPSISDTYGIADLHAIQMVSPHEGWAVGESGTILHYNGYHWEQIASPTDKTLQAVQMLAPDCGWAVGWQGTILKYDGDKWQPAPCPNQAYYFGLHMTSATEGWAVGSTGNIIRCVAGKWREEVSPTDDPLRGIAITPAGDVWISGYLNGMLHREADAVKARL